MKQQKNDRPTFELVVQVRDLDGKPTGKTKTISTSAPDELEDFLNRNSSKHLKTSKNSGRTKSHTKDKSQSQIWKESLLCDLEKLVKLPRNWDGKDGIPLNGIIRQKTERILSYIQDAMRVKPHMSPTTDGRLQIEFKNGEKSLELEFIDQNTVDYYFWDGENGISDEGSISPDSLGKFRKLVQFI